MEKMFFRKSLISLLEQLVGSPTVDLIGWSWGALDDYRQKVHMLCNECLMNIIK